MGSLTSLIADMIGVAKDLTQDLQPNVTWKAWTGQDNQGASTYQTRTITAIVEKKQRLVSGRGGEMVTSQYYIGILEPLPDTAVTDSGDPRSNPVDPRDIFILPDGQTGPIVSIDGFMNRATSRPFYTQVYLG